MKKFSIWTIPQEYVANDGAMSKVHVALLTTAHTLPVAHCVPAWTVRRGADLSWQENSAGCEGKFCDEETICCP